MDDPTYLRAYLVAGDRRWRVVLALEQSSKKIEHFSWMRAPRGGRASR